MRKTFRLASIALFTAGVLSWSAGCSRDACVPVLRGSEILFRVRRSPRKPTLLCVELAPGQEAGDVHREGWYVSDAEMSRIFEILGLSAGAAP